MTAFDAYEIHPWGWLDQQGNPTTKDNAHAIAETLFDSGVEPDGWGLYGHLPEGGLEHISDHDTEGQAAFALAKLEGFQRCDYCGEPIVPPDKWPAHLRTMNVHEECAFRLLGSAAHWEKRCSCYVPGSTENDPPHMTRREAAKHAMETFRRLNPFRQALQKRLEKRRQ